MAEKAELPLGRGRANDHGEEERRSCSIFNVPEDQVLRFDDGYDTTVVLHQLPANIEMICNGEADVAKAVSGARGIRTADVQRVNSTRSMTSGFASPWSGVLKFWSEHEAMDAKATAVPNSESSLRRYVRRGRIDTRDYRGAQINDGRRNSGVEEPLHRVNSCHYPIHETLVHEVMEKVESHDAFAFSECRWQTSALTVSLKAVIYLNACRGSLGLRQRMLLQEIAQLISGRPLSKTSTEDSTYRQNRIIRCLESSSTVQNSTLDIVQ
ncbi:hypothetical protein SISNIDRAFT_531311 [Sistotremastrum niveocremeum HHB9708]|uniref:Uncharacterized protein n=1 Tax=Sistotremastrum niveocremeum HHB9708 TaxID=1314777 RepID=A0A164PDU1_9AGAM|nr:hypothetical protein SISNIDRAFT_531311 [Sistotremastrum niveocremeum HHB9708]